MKKILALLLCFALVLVCFAGCGSSASSAAGVSSSADASSAATASEADVSDPYADEYQNEASEADSAEQTSEKSEKVYEKVEVSLPLTEDGETISMFLLIPPFITAMLDSVGDLSVLHALQERTGIVFDITPGNYIDGSNAVNLLIASGSYPDIINHADLFSAGIEAAIEQDVVIDLTEYIMNDMPNLLASLNAYGEINAIKQMTTAGGYIGYFPQIHKDPYVDSFAIGYNQDIMDELKLDAPATFDELHDVLATVHEKTGLQYGLAKSGADGTLMCGMNLPAFGSTGTGIEGFRVIDGVVEMGAVTEEMRAYCEMMAQWFSEGLIYDDFISYEDFQQTNMVAAGTLFGNGNVNAQTIGEAAVNGIQVKAIPYVTEKPGDPVNLKGSGEIVRSAAWSVSTAASDASIELICQLVDYIFSEEGTLLFNYGIEGEAYELDADGNPVWTDLITNNDAGYTTAAMFYATASPAEYICGIYDDAKFSFNYTDEQIACQDIIDNGSTGAYDFPVGADNAMTTEEKADVSALSGDLSTYVSETALSWICGQSELNDASWEAYLENCRSMGVEELTEIYQTVYDRFTAA